MRRGVTAGPPLANDANSRGHRERDRKSVRECPQRESWRELQESARLDAREPKFRPRRELPSVAPLEIRNYAPFRASLPACAASLLPLGPSCCSRSSMASLLIRIIRPLSELP